MPRLVGDEAWAVQIVEGGMLVRRGLPQATPGGRALLVTVVAVKRLAHPWRLHHHDSPHGKAISVSQVALLASRVLSAAPSCHDDE